MTRIPVSLVFAACAGLFTAIIPAFAITDAEAESIAAAEIAAEMDRRSERRARLLDVSATRETMYRDGEDTIVVRRVSPPERILNRETIDEREFADEETVKSPLPAVPAKPEINLTLFVSVTSDGSEIRARAAGNETEYTVVSRVIAHLPMMFTVETTDVRYSFFAIVTPIDTITATPRNGSGYEIYSDGSPVPKSFESAIAALHEHYLEHQAEWMAEAERSRTLQAARERHRAQHRPEPHVTTLNVWRSRPASTNSPDVDDR